MLLNYAARAITRLAIFLDPEQRKAFEKQRKFKREYREFREGKGKLFAQKKEARSAHGRRRSRQTKKIKATSIRNKFEPLEVFEAERVKVRDKEYVPHKGNTPIGEWQVGFLKNQGLQPIHKFLDIGCGDLKAGVPLIGYLEGGNYAGLDQNPNVIKLGTLSMDDDAWAKSPEFYVGGNFGAEALGCVFDFAWAHSVFTHIDISLCGKCMASVFEALAPGGVFMASFFMAPDDNPWLTDVTYRKGSEQSPESEKHTYAYRNPFHHPKSVLLGIAADIGYEADVLQLEHPKGQSILVMGKP